MPAQAPDDPLQDFATLLQQTPDFLYFKDAEYRIRFCSQSFATLCRRGDWRNVVGKTDFDLFPEEVARGCLVEDQAIFESGKPVLDRVGHYVGADGQGGWISTSKWPVLATDGKTVVGIVGVSRDVTASRRHEEGERREALRNSALLQSAADGICVLDGQGNLLQANDAFCEMLGYTPQEMVGMNAAQWDVKFSPEQITNEMLPALITRRQVIETRHRRKDGEEIEVEVSATAVEIDGQQLFFGAHRDITARKRSEAQLRRLADVLLEADRMKDVFTDVLRHDILNPAGAIRNATDILLTRESDAWKIEVLQRLRQAATNLIEMTQNAAKLASLGNSGGLEFHEMDACSALRAVLPDLEHRLQEREIALVDHSHPRVIARFHGIIKEAFVNLISNAIKYSPRASRIDVAVEDHGESWQFYVSDEGPGVPDEHKETIFNRFERLRKDGVRGSGLGLTITRQVVHLHGGQVWVEDSPSGGSIFRVVLPKSPGGASTDGPVL